MTASKGRTPLMEACWRGDAETVLRLIEEGADINAQNSKGTTPLMYAKTYAFSAGDTRIMNILLEYGADPLMKDNAGKTAADYTRERASLILGLLVTSETPDVV
jgi:ankyrin repeat protein